MVFRVETLSIAVFSIGKIVVLMRLSLKLSRTSLLFTRSVAEKLKLIILPIKY